ncbi:uncharacterized protein LOC106174705 [Lingula anatina]|uniref:Uncharacterized protein LOC106174705 n=1 Tax=Lingula anatina TaxID=7574 RepID=A0A1S3JNV2_LINAN|nr:uncharacterized protein LOC106174705 [Lingula anatina]|eukprot:XP_013411821.1 uncharacterized protein LOC106174705 [Lingula anatina]
MKWVYDSFNLLGIEFTLNLQDMIKTNFEQYIVKIKRMLQQWERRPLTPIGKITVPKTLVVPMLNHLFISLPNPDETYMKLLNTMFFQFIWGKKTEKVKRSVITGNYEQGGLKMLDLFDFIASLKCTWIKRIYQTDNIYAPLLQAIFDRDVISYIFTFGNAYLDKLIKDCSNCFWKDVLVSWKLVLTRLLERKSIISVEPIWYNDNFKIGGKPVFIRKWFNKGVKIVSDFLENNRILTKEEFEQKFSLQNCCALTFYGIRNSIKHRLMNKTHNDVLEITSHPFLPQAIELLIKHSKGCRDFYQTLYKPATRMTNEKKWNAKSNFDVHWKDVYKNCFETTKDTKLQWFQYRIIHRLLPIKSYLKTIGIENDDVCSLCGVAREDISHTFFQCAYSKKIWEELKAYIFNRTNKNITFNEKCILFGYPTNPNSPINFVILCTKFYIYKSFKKKECMRLSSLINYIKDQFIIEKFNALKKLNLTNFEKKWENWSEMFEFN